MFFLTFPFIDQGVHAQISTLFDHFRAERLSVGRPSCRLLRGEGFRPVMTL